MLTVFLITFSVMILMILLMSVGYLLQKKSLSGSCGGLSALGIEKACNCEQPCAKGKQRMKKQAAYSEHQIDISNI